jgi:hypothetical protein
MVHHTRRAASALCASLVACTLTLPVAADDDALTTAVKACAAIRKSSERLACYDNRVYPVATGATAAAPPTPSAEEVFGAESSAVAAPAKEEEAAEAPPPREELSKITAHVTAMSTLPRGELQIELDNGQVWRQVDPHALLLHTGDSVTIARGALGTFRLTTSTGRVSKVQRVR